MGNYANLVLATKNFYIYLLTKYGNKVNVSNVINREIEEIYEGIPKSYLDKELWAKRGNREMQYKEKNVIQSKSRYFDILFGEMFRFKWAQYNASQNIVTLLLTPEEVELDYLLKLF